MLGGGYTEEQKTPWFSSATPPSRPGYYELREKGSTVIFDGRYEDGRWSVAYGGPIFPPQYVPLKVAHATLEWRGLVADLPIPRWKTLRIQ